MQWKFWMSSLAGGILAILAGCHSPYMHHPYGVGGSPGVYTTPPAGAVPQQPGATTYPPGSQSIPGNAPPYNPQGSPNSSQQSPSYGNGSSPSGSSGQSSSNRTPRYDSEGQAFDSSERSRSSQEDNAVPNYDDPNSPEDESANQTPPKGQSPFSSNSNAEDDLSQTQQIPSEAVAQSGEKQSREDRFVAPVRVQPASTN